MVSFPKALFLVTHFRKINLKIKLKIKLKFNFSIEFSSKNFKISQQFAFFVQTRVKLTHGLLTSFQKYAKIMYF